MKLSRTDLVSVLVIIGSGAVGLATSASLVLRLPPDNVPALSAAQPWSPDQDNSTYQTFRLIMPASLTQPATLARPATLTLRPSTLWVGPTPGAPGEQLRGTLRDVAGSTLIRRR